MWLFLVFAGVRRDTGAQAGTIPPTVPDNANPLRVSGLR